MIQLHRSSQRIHSKDNRVESYHTFPSSEYQGFGSLLQINEHRIAPGGGFGMHEHRDVEIITYVIDGTLEHNDALNNGTVIFPGDIHRMTAGTGITHDEFNHSENEAVHLLQIWIAPERSGLIPGYEQRMFVPEEGEGRLLLLASPDGRENSVMVHQAIHLYFSRLGNGDSVRSTLEPGHRTWVQVVRGRVMVNDTELQAGDGAVVRDEGEMVMEGRGEVVVGVLGAGRAKSLGVRESRGLGV